MLSSCGLFAHHCKSNVFSLFLFCCREQRDLWSRRSESECFVPTLINMRACRLMYLKREGRRLILNAGGTSKDPVPIRSHGRSFSNWNFFYMMARVKLLNSYYYIYFWRMNLILTFFSFSLWFVWYFLFFFFSFRDATISHHHPSPGYIWGG